MAYMNETATHNTSLLSRVSALFDGMVARYRQNRLYRETFNGLNALTDRELADLGLSRSELPRVSLDAVKG